MQHRDRTRTFRSDSPDETCAFARRIAVQLRVGDVLLLGGSIGAGKTHFARCAIQALLPVPEDVPSPTYTIVQTYAGPQCEIWHADLYRLPSPDEVIELGLIDAFDAAICLIEWPDRLADLAPASALILEFSDGRTANSRDITLTWQSSDWETRMQEVLS
jgi:tRNA threonylcarbamoyladenosine biosynthesis protein TsaE